MNSGVRLLTGVILMLSAAVGQADSFRCGSRLVTDGDPVSKVKALCGPPAAIEHSEVWRRPVFWHRGRPYQAGPEPVAVAVEYWTYNLGPLRLMRRLRFEDGVLVEIATLGHGYHVPDDD